jgi:hypothetical protein
VQRGPEAGREGGGSSGWRGIPSRRRLRCSRPGAGVQIVHRKRCSIWTPAPDPLRGKLADVTGYRFGFARPAQGDPLATSIDRFLVEVPRRHCAIRSWRALSAHGRH